jgi:hypothetical protein
MGTIKLIFGVGVIVVAIYLGTQLVPVYYANFEFQDAIKTEATLETYTTKPESDIQDFVFKKAQDLEIPLKKEQIKVQRSGNQGTGSLTIAAPYTVHLDLVAYPMDLRFEPASYNKSPF